MKFFRGPLIFPDREPLYEVNGRRLMEEEARKEIVREFGPDVIGVNWYNATTYADDCDIFVMGLLGKAGEGEE